MLITPLFCFTAVEKTTKPDKLKHFGQYIMGDTVYRDLFSSLFDTNQNVTDFQSDHDRKNFREDIKGADTILRLDVPLFFKGNVTSVKLLANETRSRIKLQFLDVLSVQGVDVSEVFSLYESYDELLDVLLSGSEMVDFAKCAQMVEIGEQISISLAKLIAERIRKTSVKKDVFHIKNRQYLDDIVKTIEIRHLDVRVGHANQLWQALLSSGTLNMDPVVKRRYLKDYTLGGDIQSMYLKSLDLKSLDLKSLVLKSLDLKSLEISLDSTHYMQSYNMEGRYFWYDTNIVSSQGPTTDIYQT